MPLKTKGDITVFKFAFFDNAKCSAILVDAPKPVFKRFFGHFIENTVCGQLSKVGPNNHVSNTTSTFFTILSISIHQ
jgi:hypothetical protein